MVVTPQNASMSMGDQHRDMPSAMRDENLKVVRRDVHSISRYPKTARTALSCSSNIRSVARIRPAPAMPLEAGRRRLTNKDLCSLVAGAPHVTHCLQMAGPFA